MPIHFPTDIGQILARIEQVNPVKYSRSRNFISGAVTYLSPYLSRGVISTKMVLDSCIQRGYSRDEMEKLVQELAWREYYQKVWQAKPVEIHADLRQDQPDVVHHTMIQSIAEASTGIEAIDAGIKGMMETGYMHNHIRMYTAALACNVGKAHWKMPASWLYYHLLDGDIASNNCSWQWVAAAFSSKKYYFNQENVNKYTSSKQVGSFMDADYEEVIAMPIPESLQATTVFKPQMILPVTALPLIDPAIPTYVYTSYQLDPFWHANEKANRILVLEPSHFQQYPVSERVIQFILDLAKNIPDIQVFVGEISALPQNLISKEHPLTAHFPGVKEERTWMFPSVSGYFNSFFGFWKKCERLF